MNNVKKMRRGFTMIELIFVIVIIGILAAVAIPKLAATRDDAVHVKSIQNLVTCISDLGSSYTANTQESGAGAADLNGALFFTSCAAVATDGCFAVAGVEIAIPSDGTITVIDTADTSAGCVAAQAQALAQNLSAANGGAAVSHTFGGSSVTF